MDVKFYIFQQILTASGHPLPEHVIRREDLAELLQTGGRPGVNGNPVAFFNRLSVMLQRTGSGKSSRLQRELEYFMLSYLPPGRNLARAFLALPAADICERCYNLLTGRALDGYDRCIGLLMQHGGGTAMKAWHQRQLSDVLEQLIVLPVDFGGATHSSIVVCYRVKAALCVLMHRLYNRRGVQVDGSQPFDPAEMLHSQLQDSPLGEDARKGIMQLYFTVTGKVQHVAAATEQQPAVMSPPAAIPMSTQIPVPDDGRVSSIDSMMIRELAAGLKEEMGNIRMMVCKVRDAQAGAVKQDSLTEIRRISSREAMRMLGIGSKKLQRLRDSGKLPYQKVTRTCSYLLTDVMKLLQPAQRKGGSATGTTQ